MATPTIATVTSINPSPNDVHLAFQSYIQDPDYINRERIPYAKWRQMHIFIDDSTPKPANPTESNLKYRATNRRLAYGGLLHVRYRSTAFSAIFW
jgi:hypothetical protein